MKLCAVAFLLLAISGVSGQTPDSTFDRLSKVESFAFGPTRYAGQTSQGEKDFNILFASRSALADFERLYREGNLQAKLFALVAIRELNPSRYKQLSQSLRGEKQKVATVSGCIISHEFPNDVIQRTDQDKYHSWHLPDLPLTVKPADESLRD